MQAPDKRARFEQAALPHLDAAYNLARWLTHDGHDAEDVVQEAYLRAFTFFEGLRGDNVRAWLLSIVRNTCSTWIEKHRGRATTVPLERVAQPTSDQPGPEQVALQKDMNEELHNAVAALPVELREALVLRELEGLSYKEIAQALDVPVGTVMSRLARARARLQQSLSGHKEPTP